MDWFFDRFGRDRIVMDWLERYKNNGGYPKLYGKILAQRTSGYEALNDLILSAFEAGISFSRASERSARPCETRIGIEDK